MLRLCKLLEHFVIKAVKRKNYKRQSFILRRGWDKRFKISKKTISIEII